MSEKFPEATSLSNGVSGVHISEPFPSGGLYSACMNAKAKNPAPLHKTVAMPPGFE